jgi:hypothetical protein
MYIRCSDGRLYRDPEWNSQTHHITPTELCYKVKRVVNPSWGTARRGLKDYPLRPIDEQHRREDRIFAGKLAPALIFGIKFIGPPPVPSSHNGWLQDAAGVDDEVIDFEVKK